MRILIVTATPGEAAPVLQALHRTADDPPITRCTHPRHDIDLLTTGVGMVATAAWCARALAQAPYDLALNLGVCGSFDPSLPPGTVVHVVTDRIAELGAEDDDRFLTIQELQLLGEHEFPFQHGRLENAAPPASAVVAGLPSVDGITVNTVHGRERSIADAVRRFSPRVESMEGAAFMYACLIHGIPFAQIRAVSNAVERRNRAAWKMPEAIRSLGDAALRILDDV